MEAEYEVGGSWTTTDEKKYIDGLGSHLNHQEMTREELLEKYIFFCETVRVRFGKIDKEAVINYAKEALKCEREKKE